MGVVTDIGCPPSALSYTLAEIEVLMGEWIAELELDHEDRETMNWASSSFIAWLARREREVSDGR